MIIDIGDEAILENEGSEFTSVVTIEEFIITIVVAGGNVPVISTALSLKDMSFSDIETLGGGAELASDDDVNEITT